LQCSAFYVALPHSSGGCVQDFMLYSLHEFAYLSAAPFRLGAQAARQFWQSPFNPASQTAIGRTAYASAELFESLTRRYGSPSGVWRP
jgi:poly(3-hydroxybutyrate) depolymerase